MAKAVADMVLLKLITLVLIVMAPLIQSKFVEVSQMENWRQNLGLGEEKMTRLHFYLHDTLSTDKPSAIQIAAPRDVTNSSTLFGTLLMADDPLTENIEPTSKLVGRAQGLYGSAGQDELVHVTALSYAFTDGVYNGSSLSILGINNVLRPVGGEMPIVGGTGIFKLARGTANVKTYTGGIGTVVEYNITVFHY